MARIIAIVLLLAQLSSALKAKFVGIPSGQQSYAEPHRALPIICFDRLVNITDRFSLLLQDPKYGRRQIRNVRFQPVSGTSEFKSSRGLIAVDDAFVLGALKSRAEVSFKSGTKTRVLDPTAIVHGKSYCWGAVVDLSDLQLETGDAYQWLLQRKRYLIDNKRFKLRWFAQTVKSRKFTLTKFDESDGKLELQFNCAAIRRAAIADNKDAVKALIDMGADTSCLVYPLERAAHMDLHVQASWLSLLTKRLYWKAIDIKTLNTHLLEAVVNKSADAVKTILQRGANVNHESVLIEALKKERFRTAQVLIEFGADVDVKTNEDETVLHLAAASGNVELVKALVLSVSDLNLQNGAGETALLKAMKAKHTKVAEILIEAGADVNILDNRGNSVLMEAIADENTGLSKSILAVTVDEPGRYHRKLALITAANHGQIEIAEALLNSGIPVDCTILDVKKTPLIFAAIEGHLDIVKLLLAHGADINYVDTFGATPLFNAVKRAHVDVAKALVDAGADVNIADLEKFTPLMIAVSRELSEAVRFIIDAGADVNARTVYGDAALNFACGRKNQELIDLLVKLNARKGRTFSICP